MNSQLENAIQEAMMELDRQSADLLTDDTEEETEYSLPPGSPTNRTNKVRGGYKRR